MPTPAIGMESAGLADDLAALAERLRRVTVRVGARGSPHGTGVVWRSDGLIITNAHVTRHGTTILLSDGRVFDAELVRWDLRRDLAALRIAASGLSAARVGDAETLRVGEMVFAVGNPLGLTGALAAGMIHAIGPRHESRARWIQADLRLAPGNSGGPLADARGSVVGVNTMIADGLALAVPSGTVERFLCEPDRVERRSGGHAARR
jgi:serine protease Do